MTTYPNEGARQLAKAATKAGTQAALATRCGFPRVYIHQYLNGRVPGLENALQLKRVLKIKLESWLSPAKEGEDDAT